MFRVTCEHVATIDGKPFALGDYLRLFVRTDAAFGRNQAGLFTGARLDSASAPGATTVSVESADMVYLRVALENPSNGYGLAPALAAVPFVRSILDATEE